MYLMHELETHNSISLYLKFNPRREKLRKTQPNEVWRLLICYFNNETRSQKARNQNLVPPELNLVRPFARTLALFQFVLKLKGTCHNLLPSSTYQAVLWFICSHRVQVRGLLLPGSYPYHGGHFNLRSSALWDHSLMCRELVCQVIEF